MIPIAVVLIAKLMLLANAPYVRQESPSTHSNIFQSVCLIQSGEGTYVIIVHRGWSLPCLVRMRGLVLFLGGEGGSDKSVAVTLLVPRVKFKGLTFGVGLGCCWWQFDVAVALQNTDEVA